MNTITDEIVSVLEERRKDGGVVEYEADGNVIKCVVRPGYGVIGEIEETAVDFDADFLDCLPPYVLARDGHSEFGAGIEDALGLRDDEKPYVVVLETYGYGSDGDDAWEILSQLFEDWDDPSAVTWVCVAR